MSLARGKFGIEFNPRQANDDLPGLGWVFAVVALLAAVSLGWTIVGRMRSAEPSVPVVEPSGPSAGEPESPLPDQRSEAAALPAPKPVVDAADYVKRPIKVRNLLMRLEEAEKRRDVEMAVNAIESIRALPGSPAADLDDALARRLGALNVKRLFDRKNAQWVKQVSVRRGDSATRIAVENGSTLASLSLLNGGKVDKIFPGAKLYVMDHPRFNLVIRRRSRTADLSLNGKFFKRYDLLSDVKAKGGAYEVPERRRSLWADLGVQLKLADRTEIELLMPTGAPVLVSEM